MHHLHSASKRFATVLRRCALQDRRARDTKETRQLDDFLDRPFLRPGMDRFLQEIAARETVGAVKESFVFKQIGTLDEHTEIAPLLPCIGTDADPAILRRMRLRTVSGRVRTIFVRALNPTGAGMFHE